MRPLAFIVVAVALLAAVASAKTDPAQIVQQSASEGAKAGEVAGRAAGETAGRQAAQIALNSAADKPNIAQNISGDPELAKADPGAVNFFNEFDADKNGFWSQKEWDAATAEFIRRKYLPSTFKSSDEWGKLPKTEKNEITLLTFLAFASRTPAHNPPKVLPPKDKSKPVTFEGLGAAKTCSDVFDYFTGGKGYMTIQEFGKALTGFISLDSVADHWYSLRRDGPGVTMTLPVFAKFCSSLTGLIAMPDPFANPTDVCNPNPCTGGLMCMPDPKYCAAMPCPQYKCVRSPNGPTETNSSSVEETAYGKCVRIFHEMDTQRRRELSKQEFFDGVSRAQSKRLISGNFSSQVAWSQFDKTKAGNVNMYEFVHFCIAVTEDGKDTAGTLYEECWDVFTAFDVDNSETLDQREFMRGMRRARRLGHMPADLNIWHVWKALPPLASSGPKQLGVDPFIRFCVGVSRGDTAQRAANAVRQLAGMAPVDFFPTMITPNSTLVIPQVPAPVPTPPAPLPVLPERSATQEILGKCGKTFDDIDFNSTSYLTSSQFQRACFAFTTNCSLHAIMFQENSINGQMSRQQFLQLCVDRYSIGTKSAYDLRQEQKTVVQVPQQQTASSNTTAPAVAAPVAVQTNTTTTRF